VRQEDAGVVGEAVVAGDVEVELGDGFREVQKGESLLGELHAELGDGLLGKVQS
jgi:hypothetical protein